MDSKTDQQAQNPPEPALGSTDPADTTKSTGGLSQQFYAPPPGPPPGQPDATPQHPVPTADAQLPPYYPPPPQQEILPEYTPLNPPHDPPQSTVSVATNNEFEPGPPLPERPLKQDVIEQFPLNPQPESNLVAPPLPERPPQRSPISFTDDDPSNPIHYTRDPHKLVVYLVPFPKPVLKGVDASKIPDRFLIYTPPPPPLSKPAEGVKEGKVHKLQRKWQDEVREAKMSTAKTKSWKGLKSMATRGISTAMSYTKTSSLEFLNRAGGEDGSPKDAHANDGVTEEDTTHKTIGLEEMVLIYPPSFGASQDQVRTEFVNTMMRSKSKAQRDAVIATGLLPVTAAIDIAATLIWPFGGLLEIDSVWAYSSIRGAKTARSVTKRLTSSVETDNSTPSEKNTLHLVFTPSPRLELLRDYLANQCHQRNSSLFKSIGVPPTESNILEAIGWAPSQTGGQTRNWEDEQWEITEVKEDLKSVMRKGAREWDKWCKAFVKDPETALKK
ncbi:MAG: hypothetical protein M1834_007645 [Cirrosporium novae-zelandiae]|nr:MAG: hypothetical protein M1834_007645 [Cirrosporium novae-zelandiae]